MQRVFLFLLSVLLIGFMSCKEKPKTKVPKVVGPNLLVESGFEEAEDPFSEWMNTQHCCDYSVTQSKEQFTEGGHSLRLEVRDTDPITSGSIRSELVQEIDHVGTERWYGFNQYLENWVNDTAGEHVFQWHPANTRGTATASLWTTAGRYMLERNDGAINSGNYYDDLGPIISDEWVSWVLHIRWAADSTGVIQVWKNGKKMIDREYIPTAPYEGTYFKLGINKFGWGIQRSTTRKRVLFYDEVRIGNEKASYDDVKPRNTPPPPKK